MRVCTALALDSALVISYDVESITYTNPCNSSQVTQAGAKFKTDPTSNLGAFGAHLTRDPPLVSVCVRLCHTACVGAVDWVQRLSSLCTSVCVCVFL